MPKLQWSSWVCDADGRVEYVRAQSLAGLIGFFVAVAVMAYAGIREVHTGQDIPMGQVVLLCAAMVIPLTGGHIAAQFGHAQGRALAANTQVIAVAPPDEGAAP